VRLVTYDAGQGPRAGLIQDDEVLELNAPSLRALLAAGPLGDVETGAATPLADVSLLPPIPDPGKLICIGLNYLSHAEEGGVEAPETPTFFAKFANALVPGGTVALPAYSQKVDYEAEVAFVIGRRAKDVPEGKSWYWVKDDRYVVAFSKVEGYDEIESWKVPHWLPRSPAEIKLLRRKP